MEGVKAYYVDTAELDSDIMKDDAGVCSGQFLWLREEAVDEELEKNYTCNEDVQQLRDDLKMIKAFVNRITTYSVD